MEKYTIIPEEDDAGKRIDIFLTEYGDYSENGALQGFSRSRIQKLILQEAVLVNGKAVGKSYKVCNGDELTVLVEDAEELAAAAEDIALDIVYEDSELIVVNKPQGMVVHPAAGHSGGTLVNALLFHCGGSLSGINGVLRPGIVHRIDRDTSGLLVAAKTDRSHLGLSEQLADHSMTRVYSALCFGALKEDSFTVDIPMARSTRDRKKMAVMRENGKRAVTHISVKERLHGYTLVEARLETGRTHQIRVHLSHKGYPVVGDTAYGRARQPFQTRGQLLHAGILGFIHPSTGEYMEFEAELPEYFEDILRKIRGY